MRYVVGVIYYSVQYLKTKVNIFESVVLEMNETPTTANDTIRKYRTIRDIDFSKVRWNSSFYIWKI